ncbi:MAG: ParA family protein [Anaerolineae bacterium]|jgi:arsenite/tail-anchored protein-transporting ATPase|nr:ParA family protein [Anaerolineae bacterium]MBT7326550.1 ParA family protein [Anaerolineae bacterium]
MAWQQQQNASGGGDAPVNILLAGPIDRTSGWYQALQADARFRVSAMANDPRDLQAKLASSPEVVWLDGSIFSGPGALVETLTSIAGAVYLLVPANVEPELSEQMNSIPSVKSVYRGDVQINDLMTRAYNDAVSLRRTAPSISPQAWGGGRSGGTIAGLRVVAVWGRSGGAGSTSIAAALAQAVARRGLKTLLIGLNAPDILPLQLSIKPEPNILNWFSNPTDQGVKASIQELGDLHIIAGFPDMLSESHGDRAPSDKGSISELVTSAAYGGYAVIILDVPSGGAIAPRAISAANTWLMPALPTVAGVWNAVESFRTVTQKAAGQHRINPGNIFVTMNKRINGMLTADEWHQAADAGVRNMQLNVGFPPVAAVIPYVPEVPLAQNKGRSALEASDEFARPIHSLAEMLFGQTVGASASGSSNDKIKRFGPLKIRVK